MPVNISTSSFLKGCLAGLALAYGLVAFAGVPLTPLFQSQPHSFPAMRAGSFVWADFDNDHDLDLFLSGDVAGAWSSATSRIYWNQEGTFIDSGIVLPSYRGGGAQCADFDNDGFVDLVLNGYTDNAPIGTRVFRNLKGTNFQAIVFLGIFNGRVAVDDFNRDGFPDLALTGESLTGSRGASAIFKNENGTNFTEFMLMGRESYLTSVAWADYDHDGDPDLFVTGDRPPEGAFVFRNEWPLPAFTPGTNLAGIASGISGEWLEANNDGWPDLLILAHSQGNSFVLTNDQAGGFTRFGDLGGLGDFTAADFNSDGFSDALVLGYRYSFPAQNFIYDWVGLYLNAGTGSWTERTDLLPQLGIGGLAAGDYNSDGRMDLVMSGQSSVGNGIVYSTHLFQNATVPANHPPDAPHGLSTHIEGDTVVLSWLPGTDTEQRGGLTYNVRLAPESGGADVVSSLSAPAGWPGLAMRVGGHHLSCED